MIARANGRIVNITSQGPGVLRWPRQLAVHRSLQGGDHKAHRECGRRDPYRWRPRLSHVDPGLLPIGLTTSAIAGGAPQAPARRSATPGCVTNSPSATAQIPVWPTRLLIRIAAGEADVLSGCHLSVHDDLDQMLALAMRTPQTDIYRLRRTEPATAGSALLPPRILPDRS